MFTIVIYTTDLLDTYVINRSIYGAVGFSLDERMGNDTVIVCAMNSTGGGSVYVAWNDYHRSIRQYEATKAMIGEATVQLQGNRRMHPDNQRTLAGDRMNCRAEWKFDGLATLGAADRKRIFDLKDPAANFFLLYARGPANPNTLDLGHHSFADGLLFPFVSSETVGFCESGCGQAAGHTWITVMHQSEVPQVAKQKIAIAHATLMLISCFILHPTAVFSARFCKDHLTRCCHVFVWFHVHWICHFLATDHRLHVAFFTIYYQADFKPLPCSEACDDAAYYRRFHAVLGTIIYSFLCAQFLAGICRPNVAADSRKFWNWWHTFIGYMIWALSCTNAYMGIGMEKLGLVASYGRWPTHVLTVGVVVTIVCFLLCEWIVHKEGYVARDPNRVEKLNNLDGRSVEQEDFEDSPPFAPILLIVFNGITGILVVITLDIMLVKSAREYGFDV
ncbi:hypothetical protein M3Y99_01121400 [Aphelenchoides fujianensis]|nr:hypothetical protein M3Y99_01121400 [Aphelenchoides fujianensis]